MKLDVDETLDRVIWNLRAKAKAAGISQEYLDAFVGRNRGALRMTLSMASPTSLEEKSVGWTLKIDLPNTSRMNYALSNPSGGGSGGSTTRKESGNEKRLVKKVLRESTVSAPIVHVIVSRWGGKDYVPFKEWDVDSQTGEAVDTVKKPTKVIPFKVPNTAEALEALPVGTAILRPSGGGWEGIHIITDPGMMDQQSSAVRGHKGMSVDRWIKGWDEYRDQYGPTNDYELWVIGVGEGNVPSQTTLDRWYKKHRPAVWARVEVLKAKAEQDTDDALLADLEEPIVEVEEGASEDEGEALTLPAPAHEPPQKYDRTTRWRPDGEPAPAPSVSTLDPNVVVRSKHRGHMLVTPEIRHRMPKLYATENVPLDDKVLQVKFFNPYGAGRWYGAEADAVLLDGHQVPFNSKEADKAIKNDELYDVTFFGYVEGLGDDEWGYFSLRELEELPGRIMGRVSYAIPGIERDVHFTPAPFNVAIKGEHPDHVEEDEDPYGDNEEPSIEARLAEEAFEAEPNATVPEPAPATATPPVLDPTEWKDGMRAVRAHDGAHGTLTGVHSMTTRLSSPFGPHSEEGKKTVSYWADFVLDSGRKDSMSAKTGEVETYREVGPAPAVVPDPIIPGGGGYGRGKNEPQSPSDAWREVVSTMKTIAYDIKKGTDARKQESKNQWFGQAEAARKRLGEQLTAWDAWYSRYAHDVDLISNPASPTYEYHHALVEAEVRKDTASINYLRNVPGDWLTRWKAGDRVVTRNGNREIISSIEGEYARIKGGSEGVPLWTLRLDTAALASEATEETFDKPRYIKVIAQEMLTGDGYPDRAAVAVAVKAYLGLHGIPISTSVHTGSGVTSIGFSPPRDAKERWKKKESWSREQAELIQKLLLGTHLLRRYMGNEDETVGQSFDIYPWGTEDKSDSMTDYFHPGGVKIPAENQAEFSVILANAMKTKGQTLNRLGEERIARSRSTRTPFPVSTERVGDKPGGAKVDCREVEFDLPPHGHIRVVCFAQGRKDTWHNIYVGNLRYGWNGKKWARYQVPPNDILTAVREHGVGAFPAGGSASSASSAPAIPHRKNEACAECGARPVVGTARDSSGIEGPVCARCQRLSPMDRSFA